MTRWTKLPKITLFERRTYWIEVDAESGEDARRRYEAGEFLDEKWQFEEAAFAEIVETRD